MTGTVTDLLAECEAHGIALALAGDGGLTIDAPQGVLKPDLVDRLKASKAELLALLRSKQEPIEPTDADAAWRRIVDLLARDATFPPDLIEAMRLATARWELITKKRTHRMPPESRGRVEPTLDACPNDAPDKPTPVCDRCGGGEFNETLIHEGRSVRRDCARCGRFASFPVWYTESNCADSQDVAQ